MTMHRGCWSRRAAWRAFAKGGFGGMGGCGPQAHSRGGPEEGEEGMFGGGGFGVRRPLRFLAHKLELDETQIAEFARILDELKTERAQAEVDRRRTTSALADALLSDAFDTAKAKEGGDLRVQSAERLRGAILKALQQIHALLRTDQRARLAYLIRTGALMI